jgi:type 1 glutamine amidotransferase
MKKTICNLAMLAAFAIVIGCVNATCASAKDNQRPHVTLIAYEDEYHADATLPAFAKRLADRYGCRCSMLVGEKDVGLPGLPAALADTDVVVLFARRHALPKPQMDALRRYLEHGGALVGLRTASHAFAPPLGKKTKEPGEYWPEFDHEVLGGNYHDHLKPNGRTKLAAVGDAAKHPILAGVDLNDWTTSASLYHTRPLASGTTVILSGSHGGVTEPVAWTHRYHGGRIFYAALGNTEDFESPRFNAMLVNAVFWAMNRPVPSQK